MRRSTIVACGFAFAAGAIAVASRETARADYALPNDPNIVVVILDDAANADLRAGIKSGEYPNIARIADAGMELANFTYEYSFCCPTRATVWEGRYSHNTGIIDNVLPDGGFAKIAQQGDLTHQLNVYVQQQSNYRTAHFGRYYNEYPHPSIVDPNDPNGTGANLQYRWYKPEGWDHFESITSGAGGGDASYSYQLLRAPMIGTKSRGSYGVTAADFYVDVLSADATAWITTAPTDRPIFVNFGVTQPHDSGSANLGPNPTDYVGVAQRHAACLGTHIPSPIQSMPNYDRDPASAGWAPWLAQPTPLTPAQIAAYADRQDERMCSIRAVDDAVGAITSALQATGRLTNTVWFILSDNGFVSGQWRWSGKQGPFLDQIKTSAWISGRGIPRGVTTKPVSDADIAPTIAAITRVAPTKPFDGRSLAPILLRNAKNTAWRPAAFLQRKPRPSVPGDVSFEGLLGNRWHYVRTPLVAGGCNTGATPANCHRALFDLAGDPYELVSVAAAPANAALITAMDNYLDQMRTCVGARCVDIETTTFAQNGAW